ncbi:hypothetical protein PHMEG_00037796 [Phytophthora megakarya]|uniref:Eukaryotic/viral aspartic protease n=1 Tax=Phytophthora megakarya TaxID=4795 RepID=A0A225UJ63_9STRA|nr:hypothetical protein PHMEG_00037796 [Phytophthora megakarya]
MSDKRKVWEERSPNGSLSIRVSWMRGRPRGRDPMSHGGILHRIRKWYDPTRHAGLFPEQVEKMTLAGVEHGKSRVSRYCIYAYVNKTTQDRRRIESNLRGAACNLHNLYSYTAKIVSLPRISEFSRSDTKLALALKRGEPQGYWKRHASGNDLSSISQERAILLLDADAKVSILDTTFARKRQECVGIGDNVYTTEGRIRIKITLRGYLVYFFDIWIGDLSGQNAILDMEFMVPVGVRMGLARRLDAPTRGGRNAA